MSVITGSVVLCTPFSFGVNTSHFLGWLHLYFKDLSQKYLQGKTEWLSKNLHGKNITVEEIDRKLHIVKVMALNMYELEEKRFIPQCH